MTRRIIPVSYTHLDVYKRQAILVRQTEGCKSNRTLQILPASAHHIFPQLSMHRLYPLLLNTLGHFLSLIHISRDRNFYEIEYSCKYGSGASKTRKYYHNKFNPDFFLKMEKENMVYFLVIEIKADKDLSLIHI